MDSEVIRSKLKMLGIIGFLVGVITFIIGFNYMAQTIRDNSIGSLAETVFFSLLGSTIFISSTIVYVKSIDFIKY